MKKIAKWMIILTGVAGLSLFGVACNSGDDHDHSDHEHADPEKPAEAGDKQTAAAPDNYPLNVCVVSGEALGAMGEPVTIQHEGVTVKFCCDSCIEDFNKEPQKYLPKLTQAAKQ